MPFSDFYLIFKLIFIKCSYLKKNQKRGFLFHSPAMLTWHAGPPRGCDAALRPRGRRPRERVNADAREGRHVAGGLAGEGPTG